MPSDPSKVPGPSGTKRDVDRTRGGSGTRNWLAGWTLSSTERSSARDENNSIRPGAACSANALDAAIGSSRLPCAASVIFIAVCCWRPRISIALLASRSPPGVNVSPAPVRRTAGRRAPCAAARRASTPRRRRCRVPRPPRGPTPAVPPPRRPEAEPSYVMSLRRAARGIPGATGPVKRSLNSLLTAASAAADTGSPVDGCEVGHMQVPGPFEYERATSVDHAVGLLDRLGDGALIVAGGHSLLPMMKLRIANPEYLVDINDLAAELGYIVTDPTLVRIGAMARHREVLESDELAAVCPIFRDAERVIADPVVRNRGTVGGLALPGGSRRGSDHGVRGARRRLRGPWPVGSARDPDRRLPAKAPTRRRWPTTRCSSRSGFRCGTTRPAPTRRWSAGSATGRWPRRAPRSPSTGTTTIAAARVGLTAVNPDAARARRALADALVGEAGHRGDLRRGRPGARRRPASRSPTCGAAPSTSATWPPN